MVDSHAAVFGVGGGVSTRHGRRRRRAAAACTGLKLIEGKELRAREGRKGVKEGRRKGGEGNVCPRMNSWLRLCRQVCSIDASQDI